MLKRAANSVLLALSFTAGLAGQTSGPSSTLSDTDKVIDGLRQLSRELSETTKSLNTHLDQAIARHDRGYRSENGRQVQSADVDLIGGPPDVTWGAIRKFVSFRMLAVRAGGKAVDDPAAADMEHIQQLIVEMRKRVDASTAILRRLLVVSVVDFDPNNDTIVKARHGQLLKARAAAEEMARRAMLALPLEQPDDSVPEGTAEKTWDLLGRGVPSESVPYASVPAKKAVSTVGPSAAAKTAPVIPINFEHRKRVTVLNELSYRMAITDSGIEDDQGRHIFYQEEWVQRGQSVIRYRWRVAVETATGEHILLKRYPPRELHGSLEEVYGRRDRDYVWYLEAPEDSTEPTRDAIDSALNQVSVSQDAVRAAMQNFKDAMRDALARQDRLHATVNEPPVDSGLPEGMRQRLFTIRAHLARVPAVLDAENAVRSAINEAEATVRDLEPLAAWSNRIWSDQTSKAASSEALSSADWAQLLDRSDWEIDSVRNAETEALRMLPPDSSRAEDKFPALEKDVIIRIRRARSKNPEDITIHCLQEVWRMETGLIGTREVRRIVSLILIDPQTGTQTRAGGATRYYKASSGDILEEIFDEYAADEVSLGS